MSERTSIYKTVSFTLNDYAELDKKRQEWIKKHGVEISLPQLVKAAVKAYEVK